MQVFLTGATGYVGSAVLESFLRAGHDVTALVRDPEKAESIARHGVHPVIGDLDKPSSYASEAERSEVIVHTALDGSSRRDKIDRQAVDTLLGVATSRAASGRPSAFIYTSGWRPEHERIVLEAGLSRTPRTVVMRPGIVYGGSRGIIADLLKDAANGLVRVIGEGKNHWPCIYARDLADVYLRVATNPEASGIFHANDEADESVGDIVDSIARYARMRPDVRYVPLTEARAKMGPYADALALDQRIRSPRARALGWSPTLHSVSGNVARLLEEFRTRREAA
jgi:nucleoside-diphosphate-sugar epimerase